MHYKSPKTPGSDTYEFETVEYNTWYLNADVYNVKHIAEDCHSFTIKIGRKPTLL